MGGKGEVFEGEERKEREGNGMRKGGGEEERKKRRGREQKNMKR